MITMEWTGWTTWTEWTRWTEDNEKHRVDSGGDIYGEAGLRPG